jgi:formate C-acetyltransferase
LIVGDQFWGRHAACNYPEFGWWGPEVKTGDAELDAELAAIAAWWSARPEFRATGTLFGHTVPGFPKLLQLGFEGIAEHAERLMADNPEAAEGNVVRRAISIVCRAGAEFGCRHAGLAREMAAGEADAARRRELEAIAQVCAQVPALSARTFHEGLQALWMGQLLIQSEDPPNAQSLGRVDQFLWPLYEADLGAGRLTPEQAEELLSALWLKLYKPYDVQNLMVGGLTPEGRDGTNPLSHMILDVQRKLGLIRQVSARLYRGSPPEFIEHVARTVLAGQGEPQIFNDEVIVWALTDHGAPLEEARDYAIIGCIEVTIPGRDDPRVVADYANLAQCLEYALTNGECLLDGEVRGLETGEASSMTFDELVAAYHRQVEHWVAESVKRLAAAEEAQVRQCPLPVLSSLMDDCAEKGLDITAGGARHNSTGISCIGIANVADSLAAIRKLVHEERKLTFEQLLAALRADFEGYEDVRQLLLHGAPKYGNGDPEVDDLARAIGRHFCESLQGHPHPRGGDYRAHHLSFVFNIGHGQATGASADGRHAREPLANSLAPQPGVARTSPTAEINSVTRIDMRRAAAGCSYIMELHPSCLPEGDGVEVLQSLIRTYLQKGGSQIQFNIADAARLREAQEHPERFAHLVVRVAGYSEFFVRLSRDGQDHIIARTERV